MEALRYKLLSADFIEGCNQNGRDVRQKLIFYHIIPVILFYVSSSGKAVGRKTQTKNEDPNLRHGVSSLPLRALYTEAQATKM